MENFILYNEVGKGRNTVVHKGRKKGTLSHVAIICADKIKRPEITNHVRLSSDLDHPNIVSFYEWYETSKHLWLVVELCTGGSLYSIMCQDGCLPEDMVMRFGWDIVKGLRYVHSSGIVFSDLNPDKILLDVSGILKLSNFCLSKAEGESLEHLFSSLSTSDGAEQQDGGKNSDNLKKRLQGSPFYSSPEVLQGSETNMKSDLWALGCILHYMYTGEPPFYSDNYSELTEMILHQQLMPLRQTANSPDPPSEDLQDLLKRLLDKNPDTRMGWRELLEHPFWTEVVMEEMQDDTEEDEAEVNEEGDQEEDSDFEGACLVSSSQTQILDSLTAEGKDQLVYHRSAIPRLVHRTPNKLVPPQTTATAHRPSDRETDPQHSARHTTCGGLRSIQAKDGEVGMESEEEAETEGYSKAPANHQMSHSLQPKKSFTLDQVLELRPKSGMNEDNTETIFLLSPRASMRSTYNVSDSPSRTPAPQANPEMDFTSKLKSLLHTDSDSTVTPLMDNPKMPLGLPVKFDHKSLCVTAYSVEKLKSLSDKEWMVFLQQLCSSLEDQSLSSTRSKLNLLCYLCCVVGHEAVANRLINSTLLPVLTQQLRQAPNWDVRSKALRVMGLLALHCSQLGESSPVSEAVSTITDLLRENQRNSRVKQFLLPPLGEFLYLIASEEKKRGSPEGLWFVPAAAYTGLMRSLREGDDSIVHHMAAKAIENISSTISDCSHPMVTSEIGSALWYLFTHSTVEAVRVTAISSLSRVAQVVPAVFLAVIDTCGPAAILEGVAGAGAKVQQHLLTAMASALLTSRSQTNRVTQNKDLLLKVLRFLESPSTVTRAKTFLLLLVLIQDNTDTLLYCCQHRLMMYLEKDLRKAIPLKENHNQSGYLSQCLDLLTVYLTSCAPLIFDEVLRALQVVIGRRHPSTVQSKQLKHALPTMSVVLALVSSQVLRCQMVTEDFLAKMGLLLGYIISIESNKTNLTSALGAAVCDELIKTSLSIMEVLSQHHALISPHQEIVVDAILPPLTTLAFSRNVEWSVFALRELSELSLALLVQKSDEDEECIKSEEGEDGERAAEEGANGGCCSQILAVISESLLPRYECLLGAAEPIQLYALKLLLSLTEHSMQMCRLIKHSKILPLVLQLITVNWESGNAGLVQNAVALMCNLGRVEPLHHQGLIEMLVRTLSEAGQVHQHEEGYTERKVSHLVLQALLELLHNILKQMSVVVRSALQSQRLSCPAVETKAAEKLLQENQPLSQLSTLLIHMITTENREVWEESILCLSLLVQLYGGNAYDCLSSSCLQRFSHVLRTNMHTKTPRVQRTILRIIKRLVETAQRPDWFDCPEGTELISLLRDITTSNRCHVDVVSLADEILHHISVL